jgi:hypothetical protein
MEKRNQGPERCLWFSRKGITSRKPTAKCANRPSIAERPTFAGQSAPLGAPARPTGEPQALVYRTRADGSGETFERPFLTADR